MSYMYFFRVETERTDRVNMLRLNMLCGSPNNIQQNNFVICVKYVSSE